METVYLALGSNVGDSIQYLSQAVDKLSEQVHDIIKAPLYSSKPVGFTEQANFYNSAIKGQTALTPAELLDFIKNIEKQVGRIERFRWSPREIDIDLIFYGDKIIETPALQVPHPRFQDRDFVLKPINDLNPEMIDPRSKQTVKDLLSKLSSDEYSILGKLDATY